MYSANGNGGATAAPRVIRGVSVVHQRLDKRQRAAIAADVLAALAVFQPSVRQLSILLAVSTAYISVAARFSPEKRRAIIEGHDNTAFAALLSPPEPRLALPMPASSIATNNEAIDDNTLFDIVVTAGIDRVLTAAAEVERRTMSA
jgi:hypothetical protein